MIYCIIECFLLYRFVLLVVRVFINDEIFVYFFLTFCLILYVVSKFFENKI